MRGRLSVDPSWLESLLRHSNDYATLATLVGQGTCIQCNNQTDSGIYRMILNKKPSTAAFSLLQCDSASLVKVLRFGETPWQQKSEATPKMAFWPPSTYGLVKTRA